MTEVEAVSQNTFITMTLVSNQPRTHNCQLGMTFILKEIGVDRTPSVNATSRAGLKLKGTQLKNELWANFLKNDIYI